MSSVKLSEIVPEKATYKIIGFLPDGKEIDCGHIKTDNRSGEVTAKFNFGGFKYHAYAEVEYVDKKSTVDEMLIQSIQLFLQKVLELKDKETE